MKSVLPAVAVALVTASGAHAATFRVNTGADLAPNGCTKDDCSVREAIIAANKHKGKDTVVLRSNRLHGLAIPGIDEDKSKTGDLDILRKTTIEASKKNVAVILANQLDRVLDIHAPTKIKRLEIAGGAIAQANESGFGIRAENDRLDIKRSLITGNDGLMSNASSGGVRMGGGGSIIRSTITDNEVTANTGGLTIFGTPDQEARLVRSTVSGNTAGSSTGGVFTSSFTSVVKSKIQDNAGVGCGGIELNGGTVLRDSLVSGNDSVPSGMFTFGGGGVCMGSDSKIVGSTITGNTAAEDGGGVEVFGGKAIIDSTIHDNLASDEGGGVSILFSDPFNVERSTFTDNVAGTDGGGLRAGSARVIVKSSTFQGNEGVLGGGIVANDQPTGANDSVVDLRWSTISQNNSGSGGGIGGEDGGSFLSEGTVIDGNLAVGAQKDCDATVVSGGHNFIGVTAGCNAFNGGGDISGFPALLGPIADNGGPTLTMKPTNASALIDEGGNGCPAFDQRGKPRPRADACDIGSVETR
jgi:hypothetical protein